MRDIVSTNGFSATTIQTKNTVVKTSSTTGTLTKNDYRSYRDFLESFNDNKNSKDDQESVSSTDSGISSYKLSESKSNNTSTSSLNSEINGNNSKCSKPESNTGFINRTGSFRNYLESYTNKKFSSVKPILPPKKNLVKSEIVIQVNDPLEKMEPDFCCVTTINGDEKGFEIDIMSPPVNVEVPDFPPPPPPLQMEDHHEEKCTFSPPPPPPPPQLPDFNKSNSGKKWTTVKTDTERPKTTSPEKLQANNAAAANLAKILTQHLLPRRKMLEASENESNATEEKVMEATWSKSTSSNGVKNGQNVVSVVPPAPKLPNGNNSNDKPAKVSLGFTPVTIVPNKLPPAFVNGRLFKQPELPKLPQTPPPRINSGRSSPEFVPPKFSQTLPRKLPQSLPPKTMSGRSSPSGSVDFDTTTVVSVTDGTTKVSKADPNVRKLVYNTYRGLLGAYNNKANDMISTLPRSMVREDQGISKQLESMALQGGLEKLNGRTNPKVEQE